jgi:hypothetical protein
MGGGGGGGFGGGPHRDDRYDQRPDHAALEGDNDPFGGDAEEEQHRRGDRKHRGTRKHRHLLVVDLNGLLVDRRMSAWVAPDGTKRAPDARFGKFFIYNRPHMAEFVEWAFEHFTVGVWSSAQSHNAKTLVNHIWGKQRDRLAFVWGQDKCTHVGAMDPSKPLSKPILLKDLETLWAQASYKRFGPGNTLLLDDSPYKAAMNPEHTAIHPAEYVLGGAAEGEALLGPGGQLREYLSRVAEAECVSDFIRHGTGMFGGGARGGAESTRLQTTRENA